MKTRTLTLLGLTLWWALPSCTGPQVKIVEANPETMYALQPNRSDRDGEIVIRSSGDEESSAKPPQPTADADASRLRLPNMEELPSDNELQSLKPQKPGGRVIARPPAE